MKVNWIQIQILVIVIKSCLVIFFPTSECIIAKFQTFLITKESRCSKGKIS